MQELFETNAFLGFYAYLERYGIRPDENNIEELLGPNWETVLNFVYICEKMSDESGENLVKAHGDLYEKNNRVMRYSSSIENRMSLRLNEYVYSAIRWYFVFVDTIIPELILMDQLLAEHKTLQFVPLIDCIEL